MMGVDRIIAAAATGGAMIDVIADDAEWLLGNWSRDGRGLHMRARTPLLL